MPRFFVDTSAFSGDDAVLTGKNAAHARVLRLTPGEEVTLCAEDGTDHRCRVESAQDGIFRLRVLSDVPSDTEPLLRVTVYMALSKSDKLEHVIQKATELGACRIVAFSSQRCISRPEEAALQKKCQRWQKIAESAAEQSGRGAVPRVTTATFTEAIAEAKTADLPVFLYENENCRSLRAAVETTPARTVALMSGPEGGFTEEEVTAAASAGMQVCTLGPRILRCETAPLCALSAILYAAGELE